MEQENTTNKTKTKNESFAKTSENKNAPDVKDLVNKIKKAKKQRGE